MLEWEVWLEVFKVDEAEQEIICGEQEHIYFQEKGYELIRSTGTGTYVYELTEKLKRDLFVLAIVRQEKLPNVISSAFGIPK